MDWKTPELRQLVRAFLTLTTEADARRYLRDLLTEGEIIDLAKRLETARMLRAQAPYPTIQKATGFSTTTIARVSKWLQEGQGGYSRVLNQLHHHAPHSLERGLR